MRVRLVGHRHIYPITDILRQFYGTVQHVCADILAVEDDKPSAAWVTSYVEDTGGAMVCVRTQHRASATEPVTTLEQMVPPAEVKREIKRQLYRLLSRAAAIHFPWGSLTGIRPTLIAGECLAAHGGRRDAAAQCLCTRYDVQPEQAELAVETCLAERAIRTALPPEALCVYIGIPFCPTRCTYCSFTLPECATRQDLAPAYVEALLRQAAHVFATLPGHVHCLYIGGGTPTALSTELFARLLTGVTERLPLVPGAEITVEAGRPDTVTAAKLQVMRACGVGRVCINPQTIHERTLHRIGRAHSNQQTAAAVAQVQASGIERLNMDLIAGLPGETPEMFAQSLQQVMAWRPANVTIHTLAMKRKSLLAQQWSRDKNAHMGIGSLRRPDTQVASMLRDARAHLRDNGWLPYYLYRQKDAIGGHENVGYATRGTECLYNVCMMGDEHSVIGLGSGGMSKRVSNGRVERIPMVRNIEEYIARAEEMTQRIIQGFSQPLA